MTRPAPLIRPMTAADVEPAADLLRRGDFGERLEFFRWAIEQPAIDVLVAADRDGIRATGVASAHGHAGWVGVIFVAPDARGSGLGRRITRAVLERLETRGCRTQILIASPLGRPIYEREGFAVVDHQVRFTIDGLPTDDRQDSERSSEHGIRPFEPRPARDSRPRPDGHRRRSASRPRCPRDARLDPRRARPHRRRSRLSWRGRRGGAAD